MTIDFTCQKCEGTFELDAEDLIDGTEKLQCPHCDAKAPAALVDDFNNALAEMRLQVAALSKKFTVSFSMETDDVEGIEEEEDDEEESDEEEELDLDEDDDLDDEDEDEDFEDEDADER